jgi:hypothetical protein
VKTAVSIYKKELKTQDYRVLGLYPPSGILKTQKNTTLRKTDLLPSSGEGWKTPILLRPLERANLSHLPVIEVSSF